MTTCCDHAPDVGTRPGLRERSRPRRVRGGEGLEGFGVDAPACVADEAGDVGDHEG